MDEELVVERVRRRNDSIRWVRHPYMTMRKWFAIATSQDGRFAIRLVQNSSTPKSAQKPLERQRPSGFNDTTKNARNCGGPTEIRFLPDTVCGV